MLSELEADISSGNIRKLSHPCVSSSPCLEAEGNEEIGILGKLIEGVEDDDDENENVLTNSIEFSDINSTESDLSEPERKGICTDYDLNPQRIIAGDAALKIIIIII